MAKPSRVVQMPLELVSQKNLEKPTRWSLNCCSRAQWAVLIRAQKSRMLTGLDTVKTAQECGPGTKVS